MRSRFTVGLLTVAFGACLVALVAPEAHAGRDGRRANRHTERPSRYSGSSVQGGFQFPAGYGDSSGYRNQRGGQYQNGGQYQRGGYGRSSSSRDYRSDYSRSDSRRGYGSSRSNRGAYRYRNADRNDAYCPPGSSRSQRFSGRRR